MMVFHSKTVYILGWIVLALSATERAVFSSATLPESTKCSTQRCYQKYVISMSHILEGCPNRTAAGPGKSACIIDCLAQCKAMCKKRKPDCNGYGAVCYDPRFVGGDGVMFYFHGKRDENFCIVSDPKIHVNAHFIGKRPAGRPRDYTWVQSLGIMFGSHTLIVGARKEAVWDASRDHFDIVFDGMDIYLPQIEGALWASASADVVVERMSTYDVVHVAIENLVEITVSVVPITEQESFMHNYQITEDDCFAHLQIQFYFLELSNSVDGVLGQTYRSGYSTPVSPNVAMPILEEQENSKYFSSSLLAADCKVNQFPAPPVPNTEVMDLASDIEHFDLYRVRCQSSGLEGLNCMR